MIATRRYLCYKNYKQLKKTKNNEKKNNFMPFMRTELGTLVFMYFFAEQLNNVEGTANCPHLIFRYLKISKCFHSINFTHFEQITKNDIEKRAGNLTNHLYFSYFS